MIEREATYATCVSKKTSVISDLIHCCCKKFRSQPEVPSIRMTIQVNEQRQQKRIKIRGMKGDSKVLKKFCKVFKKHMSKGFTVDGTAPVVKGAQKPPPKTNAQLYF